MAAATSNGRPLTRRAWLGRGNKAAILGGTALGGTVLGACGLPPAAAPGAKRPENATIRFGANGNATERPVWEQVVNNYNQLQTGVTVVYEVCTAGTASATDCQPFYFSQFVAGTPPDVWRIDDEPLPAFAEKGMYAELDPLLARDARELNVADFFPRSLAAYRYDRQAQRHGQGKLYALPFNTGGDMIWFNKRIFAEAGVTPPPIDGSWSIDDFVDLARKTTAFDGTAMKTAGLSSRLSFRSNLGLLWMAGAKFLDSSGTRWTVNTPETIRAFEWMAALAARHRVVPGPDDLKGIGTVFLAGRAAMQVAFPSARPDILSRPDILPEWDVTHFPKAANGERFTRESTDGIGMPTSPKQQEAAWIFAKYIASEEGMKVHAKLGRAVPARKSVANSPDYIRPDTPQHEENLVKALDYARPQPITFMFSEAERIIRAYEVAMYDPVSPLPAGRAMQQLQDVLDKLERDRAAPVAWEPRP